MQWLRDEIAALNCSILLIVKQLRPGEAAMFVHLE